ncbi:MAG: VOC family protein [Pseudomonadota bacterium]
MQHKGCDLALQRRDSLHNDIPFGWQDTLGGTASLYIKCDDVDAVAASLPAGIKIVKKLEDSWYGMREIVVCDPAGYIVCLATPIAGFIPE